MGKKKNGGGGGEKNNSGSGNGDGGGGERKEGPIVTVVLGLDMHCDGCATRIKKSIKSFSGVEAVKGGDGELTKLTVIGKLDPTKLRECVEKKVKKKVELISPAPNKKDNNNGNSNSNNNGNSNKENNKGNGNKENNGNGNKENNGNGNGNNKCLKCCCGGGDYKQGEKKGGETKKAKEPPVSTAVMKLNLHCQGCIQRIRKTIIKTKGYLDLTIDEQKDLITVKGAIDMKDLAKTMSMKLKRTVEIVPQKKDGEKKGNENERDKDNGGRGKGGGGGDNNGRGDDNIIHYVQYGYANPAFYGYGYGYGYPTEQPQMFSDENPNACSVM